MQHDKEAGPSTSGLLSQEELQNHLWRTDGRDLSTAQQLLTSHIPNEDYSAILLNYAKDVEDIRDKVVDEAGGENPDKWLDEADKVTMPDALRYLREEYLTSVGPICKDNSPAHIADAVNEAYKSN